MTTHFYTVVDRLNTNQVTLLNRGTIHYPEQANVPDLQKKTHYIFSPLPSRLYITIMTLLPALITGISLETHNIDDFEAKITSQTERDVFRTLIDRPVASPPTSPEIKPEDFIKYVRVTASILILFLLVLLYSLY